MRGGRFRRCRGRRVRHLSLKRTQPAGSGRSGNDPENVEASKYHAGFSAAGCASWSHVRFAPGGPSPVRNLAQPYGFPWLEGKQLLEAQRENDIIHFIIRVCLALHAGLAVYLIAHPEDLGRTRDGHNSASIWRLPAVLDFFAVTGAATAAFHQCDPELTGVCATDHPKPTRFVGTCSGLRAAAYTGWAVFSKCNEYRGPLPVSCGHRRSASQGNSYESSSNYPAVMCAWIAKLLLSGGALALRRPPRQS